MVWAVSLSTMDLITHSLTPAGATEIMEILGKEESLKRIRRGIGLLQNA